MECCAGCTCKIRSLRASLSPRCAAGVLDVALDVRIGSPNFERHVAVEFSEENRRQLWVPRGFAHGFAVLSETADFFYKCDDLYSPKDEVSICWDDPAIGIDWGVEQPSLSAKDAAAPLLADVKNLPVYRQI
jgi:dTDP-4-dehydrorhamnose 3,5-epimerase